MNSIQKRLGEKIKKLRRKTGLSQERLAILMGMSRPTISQIERGDRKLTAEELLKLSKVLDVPIEQILGLKEEQQVVIQEITPKRRTKQEVRINVPQKNLEKFKEVLLYILNKVGSKPNIGETVIYKLLYFIDFDFYEKYEEQLIGATYIKNHYGPTPLEFKDIVENMIENKEIIRVESEYFQYPQRKYLPLRKPALSKLKANELEVIDYVLNKLSDMNASQISEYSHKDVPWLATKDQEVIEYETVFYRTPPYSVREYSDEI